ncbi:MAG: mannosyltransferase [Myxococcales bacterium]|nr:mannosyltransferase [Myxococcales bacterium]
MVAVAQLGRIHPDEVYQALEPAYHRAFGYGTLAWEWQAGLRNWAIPIFFSWLLRACAALGITHPIAYRAVLELPQYLLHAAMLASVGSWSGRRLGQPLGRWAILLVGLYAPVITFAGRTMGESFSAAFLVIGLCALDREGGPRRWHLLGGAMLGLSVVARYGSAPVVAAAILWLLLARRFRPLLYAALGGLAVAIGLGALDWATWGKPFHSFVAYADFNVLSGRAAMQFGKEKWSFYLRSLLEWAPLWVWPGLVFAAWSRPRLSLPLFCAAAYIVAISFTPHKEHRFLYPALVLLAVAGAPGLLALLGRVRRPDLRGAFTAVALFASAGPYLRETELDVQRPDQFRAIVKAGRGDDASGLLIVGDGVWGAGGSFYIGKNIPWHTCDFAHDYAFRLAMADARFNRAVTYDGRALGELQAAGFEVTDRIGRAMVLVRR